jgi:hypothetical protein
MGITVFMSECTHVYVVTGIGQNQCLLWLASFCTLHVCVSLSLCVCVRVCVSLTLYSRMCIQGCVLRIYILPQVNNSPGQRKGEDKSLGICLGNLGNPVKSTEGLLQFAILPMTGVLFRNYYLPLTT